MLELRKSEHSLYKEFYTGSKILHNGLKMTVNCILDSNCVRYIVFKGNRITTRREYTNDKKEQCFKSAVKALNR